MTYKQKYKLFKKYLKLTGSKEEEYSKINVFREFDWMNGFDACEKQYDNKLQKYLDEKGI